jgi:hypothetical protein
MEHHNLELKDVFFPLYNFVLVTELLGQSGAASDIFRRHEVDRDLDAVGEVTYLFWRSGRKTTMKTPYTHLMSTASRNEDCFPRSLVNPPTFDAILIPQLLP